MRSLTTTASSFFLTALLLATNTVATVASAFSNNNVTTTAPYSTRMIASVITRQQGLVSSGAATSTLESGLVALAIQSWLSYYTSDSDLSSSTSSSSSSSADAETVYNFTAYVDAMLASISATEQFTNVSKTISLPLDRLTVGQAIGNLAGAYAYESEEDGSLGGQVHTSATSGGGGQRELTENEVLALDTLNASLALQNRNQYGGFWYYVYPNWSYLDGTVSFLPFMTSSSSWSYVDTLNQITLLWTYCAQQTTNTTTNNGLLVHGYDASKTAVWANPITGGSPYVWGRSLGWYLMGLVNAWEILTTTDSDADNQVSSSSSKDTAQTCREDVSCAELLLAIQSQFTSLVHHLVPFADAETGAWWQLPTFPGRAGNFLESSSTALFVFSILKGLRLDLLTTDMETYHHANATTTHTGLAEVALRAYDALVTHFVVDYGNGTLGYNGTVTVCSLNSTATYEYYTQRPINFNAPLGEGAFILASLEVERLGL